MKTLGTLLLLLAVVAGFYAFFVFDPSLKVGEEFIVNLHRLSIQLNILIVSGVAAVVGSVFVALGRSRVPSTSRTGSVQRFSPKSHITITNNDRFMDAIKVNDAEKMRYLLREEVVSARGRNHYGRGWLQFAAFNGAVTACKVLLDHGASPTAADGTGQSAIGVAQARRQAEIETLLVSHSAQLSAVRGR